MGVRGILGFDLNSSGNLRSLSSCYCLTTEFGCFTLLPLMLGVIGLPSGTSLYLFSFLALLIAELFGVMFTMELLKLEASLSIYCAKRVPSLARSSSTNSSS
jgi:hypothetical protein